MTEKVQKPTIPITESFTLLPGAEVVLVSAAAAVRELFTCAVAAVVPPVSDVRQAVSTVFW